MPDIFSGDCFTSGQSPICFTIQYLVYSSGPFLRDLLISPLSFLFLIRFSMLVRVGRVDLRFFTGTRLAKISSINLSVSSALFRCWDLCFSDAMIKTPSSVIRDLSVLVSSNFCASFRQSDSCGDHNSSTRDSVLFTC